MKNLLLTLLIIAIYTTTMAQPRYDKGNIVKEKLDRGVVAIKNNGTVTVSWRLLSADDRNAAFNIFRNGKKINKKAQKKGGTFFVDNNPLAEDAVYEVRGGCSDGKFCLKADAADGFIGIKLDKPADMTMPDGRVCTYSANDCSVADVDGDGEYEIILKWDPSNSADNSRAGYTGNVFFDCLKLDGTRLWRIDMGQNIRAGAHYTQFMAYDFDGDGKAELMMKTSDGTIDGTGKAIGDPSKDWRCHEKGGCLGRIMEGPEYLTALLDRYEGNPAVGFCWDSGHDHCYPHRTDFLQAYGDRLIMTHLNDNLGQRDPNGIPTGNDDLHFIPYDGDIDWTLALGKLKKAKQQSILNFELKVRSFSTAPEDLLYADLPLDRFIQFAGQRARQIAALYE